MNSASNPTTDLTGAWPPGEPSLYTNSSSTQTLALTHLFLCWPMPCWGLLSGYPCLPACSCYYLSKVMIFFLNQDWAASLPGKFPAPSASATSVNGSYLPSGFFHIAQGVFQYPLFCHCSRCLQYSSYILGSLLWFQSKLWWTALCKDMLLRSSHLKPRLF